MAGRSVFFTGSAGTGKTFLLNSILKALKNKYGSQFNELVAVTAMTGIAATHIEGTTLNSALGMGAPSKYKDFRSMHRKDARERTRAWKVLVVDECSMMSAEMFEMIEHMLREVRRNGRPGGGLQLIVCGDFFQLPPVCKYNVKLKPAVDVFTNFGYAFQAPAWRNCFKQDDHITLTRIFRQSEECFATTLNRIRTGDRAEEAMAELVRECSRPVTCAEGIKPTQVFPRNADVDRINFAELAALPGTAVTSNGKDDVVVGVMNQDSQTDATTRLKKSDFFRDCMAGAQVALKEGAQVMLLKNLDPQSGLVNGSRGVVVRFVHKLDALYSLRSSLTPAQLSDASQAAAKWAGDLVPVVRFVSGREVEILPAVFRHEVNGVGECRRLQLPLKLAWTITIHKSQGLTLDAVQVSLSGIFAPGQAYVALSRARSKEGLEIVGWDGKVVKVDAAVSAFYEKTVVVQQDVWTAFCAWRWSKDEMTAREMLMQESQEFRQ